jgi:hypothetical protein
MKNFSFPFFVTPNEAAHSEDANIRMLRPRVHASFWLEPDYNVQHEALSSCDLLVSHPPRDLLQLHNIIIISGMGEKDALLGGALGDRDDGGLRIWSGVH